MIRRSTILFYGDHRTRCKTYVRLIHSIFSSERERSWHHKNIIVRILRYHTIILTVLEYRTVTNSTVVFSVTIFIVPDPSVRWRTYLLLLRYWILHKNSVENWKSTTTYSTRYVRIGRINLKDTLVQSKYIINSTVLYDTTCTILNYYFISYFIPAAF